MFLFAFSVITISACGGGEEVNETTAPVTEPAVQTQTWGNITLAVPEGYELHGGSMLDEKDPNGLFLQMTGQATNYFSINVVDNDDIAENSIETTRDVNSADDASVTVGSTEWKGVAYNSSGVDCFHMYGKVGGKTVLVMCAGNSYQSDVAKGVLESITIS